MSCSFRPRKTAVSRRGNMNWRDVMGHVVRRGFYIFCWNLLWRCFTGYEGGPCRTPSLMVTVRVHADMRIPSPKCEWQVSCYEAKTQVWHTSLDKVGSNRRGLETSENDDYRYRGNDTFHLPITSLIILALSSSLSQSSERLFARGLSDCSAMHLPL